MIDKDKVYWTCSPTVEAANCDDYSLNEPYAVKITQRFCGNVFFVSRFYEDIGFMSLGDHSSASVTEHELFETESEAWNYFMAQRLAEISSLENELEEKRADVEKARKFLAASSA